MGVPCITMPENPEGPITVDERSNTLAATNPKRIESLALAALRQGKKRGVRPALWDGQAAGRIVDILCRQLLLSK